MKKIIQLGLVLSSALILSACGLQTKSGDQNNTTNNSTDNSSKFSIRELIAKNIPQKCTYTGSNEEGSYTSDIIISGKKFKQTIVYKSTEGEEKINSISDGEYVYTWGTHSTGSTFATKLKADFDATKAPEVEENDDSVGDMSGTSVDLDADFEGKCSPAVVSDADFQPPKDVQFQDYSKMMEDWQKLVPSMTIPASE